jgi:hypothetical protein
LSDVIYSIVSTLSAVKSKLSLSAMLVMALRITSFRLSATTSSTNALSILISSIGNNFQSIKDKRPKTCLSDRKGTVAADRIDAQQ